MTNGSKVGKLAVLVGVDDSPGSLQAMRVGADEAALRNTELRIVHVRPFPAAAAGRQTADPAMTVMRRRLTDEVTAMQAERVAAGLPVVTVRTEVIQGDPTRELLAGAAQSILLVLGVDTHRGLKEIVTTVGEGCATRPPCPVLIVPAPTHPPSIPGLIRS